MDLWWLLSYRSKLIATHRLPIANRIVYLDVDLYNSNEQKEECERRNRLLETFDVEYISCEGRDYTEKYDYACSWLKNSFIAENRR